MVSISSPEVEAEESDLVKLERENRELRRQVEALARRGGEEGREGEERYEELVREVARLQGIVTKVQHSRHRQEYSRLELVSLLESVAAQLSGDSHDSQAEESEYFDSLLTKSQIDSDSHREDSDSYRPSICGSSTDSFHRVARHSGDSWQPCRHSDRATALGRDSCTELQARTGDSYSKLYGRKGTAWNSYDTLPGRLSNKTPGRADSYKLLPHMTGSYSNLPHSCDRFSLLDSRKRCREECPAVYRSSGSSTEPTPYTTVLGARSQSLGSSLAIAESNKAGGRKDGGKVYRLLKHIRYLVVKNK